MEDLLNQVNQISGVLAACFVNRNGGYAEHAGLKEMSREKMERSLKVLSQSMDALGEGAKVKTKSLVITTPTYRLLLQNLPDGTLCVLCTLAIDLGALRGSLAAAPAPRAIVAPPKPTAPPPAPPRKVRVVEPKPVTPPPPPPVSVPTVEDKPVAAAILDEIYGICEEELGDLASTIFENQVADSKIREGTLTRERVLKFCLSLQKDAGMIIGPKASKAMADRMLAKLK